ncbi:hypothetical protein HanXRQr2_Chr16g0778071 [Helianthus annuus]|uniref:Uncharacterized protein n=2 Tax=Helianthus annuus TaxID=4232 RepID=A0A9K3DXQ2_HELAN|nr:hypothetical protein HanXRQr2_Chr16g0778071 [Helianthus annuus]KAJ0823682.1 hypothetical protein HanPSC8_Chr16g0746511 [Helianthus annuus]
MDGRLHHLLREIAVHHTVSYAAQMDIMQINVQNSHPLLLRPPLMRILLVRFTPSAMFMMILRIGPRIAEPIFT